MQFAQTAFAKLHSHKQLCQCVATLQHAVWRVKRETAAAVQLCKRLAQKIYLWADCNYVQAAVVQTAVPKNLLQPFACTGPARTGGLALRALHRPADISRVNF